MMPPETNRVGRSPTSSPRTPPSSAPTRNSPIIRNRIVANGELLDRAASTS